MINNGRLLRCAGTVHLDKQQIFSWIAERSGLQVPERLQEEPCSQDEQKRTRHLGHQQRLCESGALPGTTCTTSTLF